MCKKNETNKYVVANHQSLAPCVLDSKEMMNSCLQKNNAVSIEIYRRYEEKLKNHPYIVLGTPKKHHDKY